MEENIPYGFKRENKELVVDLKEKENVKYVFDKMNEYLNNPPKELIDLKIKSANEEGIIITEDEAKNMISFSEIEKYVTEKVNQKCGKGFNK